MLILILLTFLLIVHAYKKKKKKTFRFNYTSIEFRTQLDIVHLDCSKIILYLNETMTKLWWNYFYFSVNLSF